MSVLDSWTEGKRGVQFGKVCYSSTNSILYLGKTQIINKRLYLKAHQPLVR